AARAAPLRLARERAADELELTVQTGGAAVHRADERAFAAADHAAPDGGRHRRLARMSRLGLLPRGVDALARGPAQTAARSSASCAAIRRRAASAALSSETSLLTSSTSQWPLLCASSARRLSTSIRRPSRAVWRSSPTQIP